MSKKPRRKGFALATLLIMIPLMLILVAGLFAGLQAGNRWTGAHYGETAAHYVAEAGAAHVVQALQADAGWVAGFGDEPMANGQGSYSVVFNQSGSGFTPSESVNNHDGSNPDSFLGADTVPNGAALIVVQARVGAHRKREVFLVGTGDNTIRVEQALLTNGKIKLEGETRLDAVESLAEQGNLPVLVQSNLGGNDSDLITWTSGGGGGSLAVEGEVRSAGTSSSAVDLSGYTPTDGITTGAAQVNIPPAGIETTVFSKRSATAFTGGNSVPAGENYYDATSSALIVSGDLVLDGDLYVEGDLQVNGSVSGTGSIYVSGSTEIFGDSRIDADNKVALYSHGHVTLSGFEGDRFLDGIASGDSTFAGWLGDSRWGLSQVETLMSNGAWAGSDLNALDLNLSVLAPHTSVADRGSRVAGRGGATLIQMKNHIESLPASPSRDFMIKKLQDTADIFSPNGDVLGRPDTAMRANFAANGEVRGIVDAANDLNDPTLKLAAYNLIRQLNYDRLGSSYFQGLIYTNGGFYAENQVTVLGAVVVNDDGSQSTLTTSGGDTVEPGDLILKGGSNVTYVKDFFFGPNAGGAPGPRKILLHLGNG